ncbi:MAG: hypothetical protein JSS91_02855 [Bacteroidetes bacterium]|nr:hypothetical protein [Bacteroidota bacterium]
MKLKRNILFLLLFTVIFICGWGSSGHKVISRRATFSFPSPLVFLNWADSLAAHSSDADARKSSDPNEGPRHFIDIDDYPEFVSTGRIPQDLDSLIAIHGSSFVYAKGILPFSIMATTDSLKKYFQLHDYHKAMLHASDLGHYVADGHQPLHITRNYDGQYTNQSGVHSRYETQMINRDTSYITYNFENAVYVQNINQFVFDFIYDNYKYVDSVLKFDSIAHAVAQNYSTAYYQKYWQLSGNFTTLLFNNASHFISSLIYTAWVNSNPLTLQLSALIEGFYDGQNNIMISDSAKVYLRSSFSPYSFVDSSKAILDNSGSGTFSFTHSQSGVNYYLVFRHRNSIETWSGTAKSFDAGNLNYNFTDSSSRAYGNNMVLKGNRYCIYSGDQNQDGTVDAADMSAVDNDLFNFVSGYVKTDLNGDSNVDVSDLSIADNNSSNFVTKTVP